ncbi:hypothetical protein ATHSA_0455 [Athalassotoga saccharophila]|nr:hypothetical protein ATHSA_0455 [Athalassotoga saccharophila]
MKGKIFKLAIVAGGLLSLILAAVGSSKWW